MPAEIRYPIYPPGFWRRIILIPSPGTIDLGLEDDAHRFLLRICHEAGNITDIRARADRFPWSTCADAGPYLCEQLIGRRLGDVAALESASHCTHLLDLAVLGAAQMRATSRLCYDMRLADRIGGLTTATLSENDRPGLVWPLDGTEIIGPGQWAGRDLRKLAIWKGELSPQDALWATMLRRAVMVSGVRRQPEILAARAADMSHSRIGACYTHQLPRAENAIPSISWRRDFSGSADAPLRGFGAEAPDHDETAV